MEKNQRLMLIINGFFVAILLFQSCYAGKNTIQLVKTQETSSREDFSRKEKPPVDTVSLHCNGKRVVINQLLIINQMTAELYSCVEEKAFLGDIKYELVLAEYLRQYGCNHRRFMNNSRFRGDHVFNALLEAKPKFNRSYDFDGEPSDCTDACICISNLESMMETVNGKSPSDYFFPLVYKSATDYYSRSYNDEEIIEFDKKFLLSIKEAWNKGLIVLKPYGKK